MLVNIIKRIVRGLLDMPKTLYVNFKCLSIRQAVRLPILVDHKMVLGPLHPNIMIAFPCPLFGIRLGIGGTESRDWGKKTVYFPGRTGAHYLSWYMHHGRWDLPHCQQGDIGNRRWLFLQQELFHIVQQPHCNRR